MIFENDAHVEEVGVQLALAVGSLEGRYDQR
jgi:hypothetical protein